MAWLGEVVTGSHKDSSDTKKTPTIKSINITPNLSYVTNTNICAWNGSVVTSDDQAKETAIIL